MRTNFFRTNRIFFTIVTVFIIVSLINSDFFIIFVGAVVIFTYAAFESKCPSCHKFFGKKLLHKKRISERTIYKKVIKKSVIEHPSGETTLVREPDVIPVTIVEFINHYICRNCGHEWQHSYEKSL